MRKELNDHISELKRIRKEILDRLELAKNERDFLLCHTLQKKQLWYGLEIRELEKIIK